MTTVATEPAIARRRSTRGAVLTLLVLTAVVLAAAAWGAWRQPVGYIRDGRNATWSDRLLDPVWSNLPRPGFAVGDSAAISADGRIAVVLASSYLYRTEDGGARWVALPLPGWTSGVRKVALSADGRHAIAISREREILRTADGGATWVAHDSGVPDSLYDAALSDDGMRALVVGFDLKNRPLGGRLLRTGDGGRTWSAQAAAPHRVALAADGLHAIMVGYGKVWRTTDGGATWTVTSLPDSIWLGHVALSADGRMAVGVGLTGAVWRSEDGGQTWAPRATLAPRWLRRVFMSRDGSRVVALSYNERDTHDQALHVSVDGGASWTTTALDREHMYYEVALSADGLHGIMVAAGRRPIWRTSDGGKTWQHPEPAVRLMPYWPWGALGFAVALSLALGMVTRRRRPA